ncbi:MAG: cupin domain-containing protein [Leptonema sp. (in: bacteria)]
MLDYKELISYLNLIPHPEGGFYRESYRSNHKIDKNSLKNHDLTKKEYRNTFTLIYYLLVKEDVSVFHKLKSEEIWHFYLGSPIKLHLLNENTQKYESVILGNNFHYHYVIPDNIWFAAEVVNKNSFALVGCTVSPGFEFEDFELGSKEELISKFPNYKKIIETFTK